MTRSVARAALVLGLVVAAATAVLPRLSPRVHANVRWHDGAATDPWGRRWRDNHGLCRTCVVSNGPDGVDDSTRWRSTSSWWRRVARGSDWPFPRDDVRVRPAEELAWVALVLGLLGAARLATALLLAVGHLGLPARARRRRWVAAVWVALVATELFQGGRLLVHLLLELWPARRLLEAASPSPLRIETVAAGTVAGLVALIVAGALLAARDRRRRDVAVV